MANKTFNQEEQAILNILIMKGSRGYDKFLFEKYYRKDSILSLKRKKMMTYNSMKQTYRVTKKGIISYYKSEDSGSY